MIITVARKIKNLMFRTGLAVLLILLPAQGSTAPLSDSFHTTKTVLDNGLTVLVTEIPGNPMVSLYALFRAGSATEGRFLGSGISHFMEHLMFKGTHSQEVGAIASSIQAIGGTINASTGMDFTIYTVTVPAEFFKTALNVLADMVQHPNFDPVELEKEREVIFREMIMNEDNSQRELIRQVFATAYLNHPYRLPVIGFRPVLEEVDREDVQEYYHSLYSPNNMVFSVAGNINVAEVMPLIGEAFSGFARSAEVVRNLPTERPQIVPRHFEKEFPTQVTLMAMAFPGVSLLDEDLFAMDVLAKILGEGKSSRLYQELYEKDKRVYSIGSWNYTPVDPGLFVVQATLDDGQVEGVRGAVEKEIRRIQDKGVTSAELAKARRQVISDYVRGQQTTGDVAWRQAVDFSFAGDERFSLRYVDRVQQVSQDDLQRVARKYLRASALNTVIIRPTTDSAKLKAVGRPVNDIPFDNQIEKIVFDNGLTVLLRQDSTFPWVDFQVVLKGGSRQESDADSGLSQLFQSVWTRGTKTKSAAQIDDFLESRGMDMGAHAGRNSVGVNVSGLKGDVDAALELLVDVVFYPVFPEEQLEKAKADQLKAIERQRDNIFQFTAQVLRENLYQVHPFRLNPDGTPEAVAQLRREDLVAYHQFLVEPHNMVLAVYGDIAAEDLKQKIRSVFGRRAGAPVRIREFAEPEIAEPIRVESRLPKQQAMLMVGFHAVDLFSSERYKLELTAAILGSSFSGRLFNVVREEFGEAYTLGGALLPSLDTGFTYFYVLTVPESIPKVEELVRAEIERLAQDPVSEDELQSMKNYLIGTYQSQLQTNAALAMTTALDDLYGLGHEYFKLFPEKIQAVTAADVTQMARKYLDLQKAVTVITLPEVPAAIP